MASCNSAKRIACEKCKNFNEYIKTTWVYDAESDRAFINSTIDDYGFRKNLDVIRNNKTCWIGMKAKELESILPFPENGIFYRKDRFHIVPTRECFQCRVKKVGCDNPIFEKYNCQRSSVIVEFIAKDTVKEVNLFVRAPGYHALEIK